MTGAALSLQDLGKRWPDGTRALEGVTLEVPAGSTLVVLGRSGAGKSTLLRLIAGLEQPDGGRIVLGERELVGPAGSVPPEARGVGMVFQALELWPHLTVAEHIAFGLPGRPRGRRAARHEVVRRLAAEVGLDDGLLRRRPDTLSGGEQQRVAIARTLAAEPGVILYDEPLANLDPERRAALRALIRRLAREHDTTVVYVTHDAQEALELGDAVAVFAHGRLVEHGEPVALYRHPASLEAARALGPVTALEGTVRDGQAHTPLGAHATSAAAGACVALWRPEGVRPRADAAVRARVLDVVARGSDYAFLAEVEGASVRVHGISETPLEPEEVIGLDAGNPNRVLAGHAVKESA